MKCQCKAFLMCMLVALLTCVAFGADNTAPAIVSAPYAVPAAVAVGAQSDLCVLAGDDQLPSGVLTYTWTKISGPGTAAFGANNGGVGGATCAVSVDAAGSYKFAVSVSDGALSTRGEVAVEAFAAADAGSRETTIGVPLDTFVSIFPADERFTTAYEPGEVGIDFFVNRSGDLSKVLTVYFSIRGTAIANTDYVFTRPAFSGATTLVVVTIPAGDPFAVFSIKPKADNIAENNETVTLTIIPIATLYKTTSNATSVTATISDLPQVKVRGRAHAAEGGVNGNFEFVRSGGAGALTLKYSVSGTATKGTDYDSIPGSITIPAGQNTVNLPIKTRDDTHKETTETVKITLTADAKYAIDPLGISDTIKLRDNDNPTVIVFEVNSEASEPGVNTGGVTFKRYGNLTAPLTINYSIAGSATNGVDYVALNGKATFAAGADLTSIQIKVKDDTRKEGDEDVVIRPAPGTGYQIESGDNAFIRIIDND